MKCRRGGRINRYPFLVILPFSIETIPIAHALSAEQSAVSKSIATNFIAMTSLKIQFVTRHREAGNSAAASASALDLPDRQLPKKRPATAIASAQRVQIGGPLPSLLQLRYPGIGFARTCSSLVAATGAPSLCRLCHGPVTFAPCA
jgi:hypothetical protein